MDVLLLLVLAAGIYTFFWYAARAAFKADSRQRRDINKKFNEIVSHLKPGNDEQHNP